MNPTLPERARALLVRWAAWAERQATDTGRADQVCYGPGYRHWGVQSNWNYVAVLATLAAGDAPPERDARQRQALAALRFLFDTHVTGTRAGQDGLRWGRSWISPLGIERAMHGMAHLLPALRPDNARALRRLLVDEADWLLHHVTRGAHAGVIAGTWNAGGRNAPESNLWCGSLLWRAAAMYPDEAAAPAWRERAHAFLLNAVSVETDAARRDAVAGKPVCERHVGANFFPHYALDHHGYLNVGYMAICTSHAAILHFDLKRAGWTRPESLDHHQADLWEALRRFVFADGRLARIGGDSRVRYAYCQEYLLPSLLYAADRLRDPQALEVAERQFDTIEREAGAQADGSFYGARLAVLARGNPHYYTRLESDRACALAMLLNDLPLVEPPPAPSQGVEASVRGEWIEPEHGAVLSRSPTRFASFAWRAYGLAQGLCLDPQDSSLAEWSLNLTPVVRFLGDLGKAGGQHRRLLRQQVEAFDGGFVACGAIREGVDVSIDEGAACTDQAVTHVAFAALPDGHTCVGLHYVVAAADRFSYLVELKGLHLNVPNDVFNGCRRTMETESARLELDARPPEESTLRLGARWLNLDGRCGVVLLYGGESLILRRHAERRGGVYRSLFVDEVCCPLREGVVACGRGEVLMDLGFAVLAGVDATATQRFTGTPLALPGTLRGVRIEGVDGTPYSLVANFGEEPAETDVEGQRVPLAPGQARLFGGGAHRVPS